MPAFLDSIATMLTERSVPLFIASAVLFGLEMVLPLGRQSLRSRLRGAIFWVAYLLITVVGLTAFMLLWSRLGVTPLINVDLGFLAGSGPLPLRIAGWIAIGIVATILGEFFYYWFHRLQHSPLMWRFHKVHHAIREMNAFNSAHHFTEELLRIPFVIVPMSLLFHVDTALVPAIVWTVIGLQGQYEHSHVRLHLGPLRYIVADNRYHRIHHSIERRHYNRNFGSFTSVWDIVFGTAYFPKKDEWPDTGIVGVAEPETLKEFLLMPFVPERRQPGETPDEERTPRTWRLRRPAA